mgnify:CR=1 FL=1
MQCFIMSAPSSGNTWILPTFRAFHDFSLINYLFGRFYMLYHRIEDLSSTFAVKINKDNIILGPGQKNHNYLQAGSKVFFIPSAS